MRAQLLRSGDEPLAQLLYLGASGAPLALYAKKSEETAAPSFKRYGALGGVAWVGIRHFLSPHRRGRRGVADEARRGDQGRDGPPAKAVPDYSPLPKPQPKPKP